MATVNETLADEAVAHAVDLAQYSAGVLRRMVALLNQVDSDLAAALADALERLPADSFTVVRLEQLLGSVRDLNAQAYAAVSRALETELQALAEYEAGYQLSLFGEVIPEPVQVRFPIASISPAQVYAAAMSRPFQGRLLREWASQIEEGRMAKIREAVRVGYLEGKTSSEIVRDIRGTRAEKYADGILQRPRRDLMAVVQTAIGHTAAVAREQFVEANQDIIKAERWVSTLDNRTSAQCRIRDRLQYEPKTHKPIGHKIPWLAGPGRLHFNCRSTSTPVTKSWLELGIPIDEMSPGERASMDGQVPAETTYSQWLQRQSAARQDQVLGPERGRLLRQGSLKLEDFYSQTGQWLTIEQLKSRDANAFARIAA
ncbi:hypothetical protein [Azotobacter beijerinckii]|uniref:hypothetical protein n=1 Tax=Azotobacter beijerinckii TaxID=170623 RepID=UPI002955CA56|nr:hypothetical protein [Azotobacter beijerinckii]MDV7209915.1 hypothetical protein [Azotobacter beijerinckii]